MDAIRFGRGAMDGVGVGLVARLGNLARDILTATASRTHRTTLQKHFIRSTTPTFFWLHVSQLGGNSFVPHFTAKLELGV